MDYDDFAWLYNRHWKDQFTPVALAVLDRLVVPGISSNSRILDLCCGTGQLAQTLCQRGYVVTGLDGSSEMLEFARENAPGVEFIIDDARYFRLPAEYDVVISMFDALNHVMSIDELTEVFRNVFNCLKPAGLFLFDMNLEPGYIANWNGYHGFIEDDHVCVFPNSYDPENHTGKIDFTLFRLDDGEWRRSNFTLTQKCYPHEELLAALRKAGFAEIEDYSYDRKNGLGALTPASIRAFFLCRKNP